VCSSDLRQHQIWDYRRMPLQWRGQVCLPYTALWCLLSAAVLTAATFAENC